MSRTKQTLIKLQGFIDLARLRIVGLVLVSCAIGYVLSDGRHFTPLPLLWALLGTAFLSAGSCTLNCYLERERDSLMERTAGRPLPAGLLSPNQALLFGLGLCTAGCFILLLKTNWLASLLGLAAAFVYLLVYTPAKRITWLNTSIGAIPGAIPPLIGWAAGCGQLGLGAWLLFAMMFVWQHTHFYPIAWLLKEDYARAGFQMLPVLEENGATTFKSTLATAVLLIPISILLYQFKLAGPAYCAAATFMGILLVISAMRLLKLKSRKAAGSVLALSLFYLPVLLTAIVVDRCDMQLGRQMQTWLTLAAPWT
ncbi:MAG TPA: heme o synthase [Chroococcales cyanobacterium]